MLNYERRQKVDGKKSFKDWENILKLKNQPHVNGLITHNNFSFVKSVKYESKVQEGKKLHKPSKSVLR